MTTFYITTPIYYVNDVPHLGHAYCTMVADALARFHRMRGDDTRFLTGTDEHGQKVEQTATERGLTPRALVDQVAPRFEETWQQLGISEHGFIRTTDATHERAVAALWKRIRERNPEDLYLASYQGWYCVGCEAFYTESQLVKDGDAWVCPTHKRPVSWLDKERSWFFRLSRYAKPLLDHIAAHPDFIRPEQYRKEIVAFLEGGLRDLSVSRTSFAWGIQVPEPDPEGLSHVIYVWMDALTNYLSHLCPEDGTLGGPAVERYWPHAIHLIGKDILRFHAVYWPAFLMSAGLPLPAGIFSHGWWTVRGEKISKSMPATRIDPVKLADALAVGPLGRPDRHRRHALLPHARGPARARRRLHVRVAVRPVSTPSSRTTSATWSTGACRSWRAASCTPPARARSPSSSSTRRSCASPSRRSRPRPPSTSSSRRAARSRRSGSWYARPTATSTSRSRGRWPRNPARGFELAHVFHNLARAIAVIGGLVMPVLPTTGRLLRQWVGVPDDELERWPAADDMTRTVGRVTRQIQPLFPRLDDAAQTRIVAAIVPEADRGPRTPDLGPQHAKPEARSPKPEAAIQPPEAITYDDFAKLELRAGRIVEAVAVPKKDKLLHLQVDLGEGKPRSIVAGIAQAYRPEQLVGKQVLVVANLAPRKLAGLVSEGMILAAGDEQILGLSGLDRDVPPGTRVR